MSIPFEIVTVIFFSLNMKILTVLSVEIESYTKKDILNHMYKNMETKNIFKNNNE